MEPEGSLPLSQVPATNPYHEPALSSPYPHITLTEYPWLISKNKMKYYISVLDEIKKQRRLDHVI
jgi:hypothetical protein